MSVTLFAGYLVVNSIKISNDNALKVGYTYRLADFPTVGTFGVRTALERTVKSMDIIVDTALASAVYNYRIFHADFRAEQKITTCTVTIYAMDGFLVVTRMIKVLYK